MHICLIAIKVKSGDIWNTIPVVKGDRGESAYEIAVRDGFEGTEEEWLESLSHGPKGDDGAPGNSYQFIFKQTDISQAPITPESSTSAIPEGWTASPSGVNTIAKYEWVSVRLKTNEVWSVFSTPALWAIYGFGDSLPDIYIEDVIGLQEALNDLTSQLEDKISTDLLPEPNTIKLPGADAFGVVLPKFIPIATVNSLGGIKLGSTLSINSEGLANVNLRMHELKEALDISPTDGAVIVWDATLGKYKNTNLSITGIFHPLYGKDNLNFRADILRSKTLIIPKTPTTPDADEVALHAIENGYSITDPDAFTGAQKLDDLNDVAITLSTLADGDSLFKQGTNFVNQPAYNKEQIIGLFNGLSGVYHPLGGSYLLDFLARDLRSRTLFIPTEDSSAGQVGVSIFAQENGYSIVDPGEAITEFGELHDVLALTWLNGQALLYRNGIFGNETIYNASEVDALLAALNLGNYYTKQQALQTFHPKFGISGGVPLDLSADRLKSNTLLVPKTPPVLENTEVALHAQENGYSIVNPEEFITNFSQLDDISNLIWTNGQSIIFRDGVFSNELIYNKTQVDSLITNLDMTTYLKKTEAVNLYHPKFGFLSGVALDFTANRLKSSTLLIPKDIPVLENSEVGLHALENGYSIEEPSTNAYGNLVDLEDVDIENLDNNQALFYNFITNKWINKTVTFNMIPDYLNADKVSTTEFKRFVTDAQIISWNNKWTFDIDVIKGIKVDNAVNADKLGGIDANKYWHDANSNLFTVDWKAKVLRSEILVIPKEIPVDLENNEVGIFSLENGYTITEPGGGVGATVLNDLDDVVISNPENNHSLFFDQTLGVFFNALSTFDRINGTLDPARVLTNAANRFVSDMQIIDWNSRESTLNKNVAGGYLGLNANAKIDFTYFPDAILGQVKYGGTFNINGIITSPFADLNGIDINTLTASAYTGYYFISQATTTVVSIDVLTGDWIISNGAAGWDKVDNTDAVTSVNGRIGPIILTKSDVGLSNVDNTADSLKNVLSATKLFTARTLWGQSFDGTSNITGSLIDVTHITGSGIVNMGAILIPKTLYPTIPNNTVAIHAVENGYSIYDPEAGSVGSLDDLSDVDLIARVDKQLFYYSSTLGKFTNGIIDFSYISGNLASSRITDSPEYRFVTDAQKTAWTNKQDKLVGTGATSFVKVDTNGVINYDNTAYVSGTPWTAVGYWHSGNHPTILSGYGISSSDTMFDGKYLSISPTASNPLGGNFAIGSASGRNFIQSHYSQPLDLNPLGNAVTINGYTPYHSGNIATIKSDLGLGSNAYNSTAYALLAGSTSQAFSVSSLTMNGALSGATTGSFSGNVSAASFTSGGNAVLHAGNYSSYALPLSGGTIIGETYIGASDNTSWLPLRFRRSGVTAFVGVGVGGTALQLGLDNGYLDIAPTNLTFVENGTTSRTLIHSGNYSSYALPLSGGILSNNLIIQKASGDAYTKYISDTTETYVGTDANGFFITSGGVLRYYIQGGVHKLTGSGFTYNGYEVIHSGNIGSQSVNYAINSSKLYSTDSQYAYGSGAPYYGYLTYNVGASRWRFKVYPATPSEVEVAYADSASNADTLDTYHASYFATASQLNASNLSSGYLPYWNNGTLGNSPIFASGSNVGIGNTNPTEFLSIGDLSNDRTARRAMTFGGAAYGEPGAANQSSYGDKIILYNSATGAAGDVRIGIGSIGDVWYKGIAVHRWYLNLSSTVVSEQMRLDGNGLQIGFSGGRSEKLAVNGSGYFNGALTSTSSITSGGNLGFRNDVYYGNVPNPIWSFGNAYTYGMAYYQGSALAIGDAIGFHFGTVASPPFYVTAAGRVQCESVKIGSSWEAIPNGTSLDLNNSGTKASLSSTGNFTTTTVTATTLVLAGHTLTIV